MPVVLRTVGYVKKAFSEKPVDLQGVIEQMVGFAQTARRDGLLALEGKLQELKEPFLLRGIQMVIDGVSPENVRSILVIDLEQMATRHSQGKGVIDAFGAAAPSFGMIGTLVGLVLMLQNLSDPSALGPGMAIALITTFYGAVLANLIFIPIAGKLSNKNNSEVLARNLMIEGIIAIQGGENPNVIRERLFSFLSPAQRPAKEKA
jgi:chemotaxis protein MotA